VSYSEKIKLISESKIDVVHSLTGSGTPQIKTRPFEAAFCQSLIICKKDKWNIIEKWFEPNKEFLYYENQEELEILIKDVLENYDKYLPIIENAYHRAINNYTTEHFVKKYLC
jgi:spore maturation protein CgeB